MRTATWRRETSSDGAGKRCVRACVRASRQLQGQPRGDGNKSVRPRFACKSSQQYEYENAFISHVAAAAQHERAAAKLGTLHYPAGASELKGPSSRLRHKLTASTQNGPTERTSCRTTGQVAATIRRARLVPPFRITPENNNIAVVS